jgi:chemotaxis protein CheC
MPALTKELNDLESDALREVASIGSGNALTALAAMTDETFGMSVPIVGAKPLASISTMLGDPESLSVAVYMPVIGDIKGHAVFLFDQTSACELAGLVLGHSGGERRLPDEMECSALTEIGNILVSAFLNATSEMTGLSLRPTPPGIAIDMKGAILESILAAANTRGDQALTITTCLSGASQPVEGIFLVIPEPDSLPILINALGMDG